MNEIFAAKVQTNGRITIPLLMMQILKLKEGDTVKVSIEKIKTKKSKV